MIVVVTMMIGKGYIWIMVVLDVIVGLIMMMVMDTCG